LDEWIGISRKNVLEKFSKRYYFEKRNPIIQFYFCSLNDAERREKKLENGLWVGIQKNVSVPAT
jgi:hypothetical protein